MNKLIPKIGAAIVTITVFLFAVFLIVDFPFGYYLVCMFFADRVYHNGGGLPS